MRFEHLLVLRRTPPQYSLPLEWWQYQFLSSQPIERRPIRRCSCCWPAQAISLHHLRHNDHIYPIAACKEPQREREFMEWPLPDRGFVKSTHNMATPMANTCFKLPNLHVISGICCPRCISLSVRFSIWIILTTVLRSIDMLRFLHNSCFWFAGFFSCFLICCKTPFIRFQNSYSAQMDFYQQSYQIFFLSY